MCRGRCGRPLRKSTFSNNEDDHQCVEVAFLADGTVALRDTKDRTLPPHRYSAAAWHALTAGIRASEFDLT